MDPFLIITLAFVLPPLSIGGILLILGLRRSRTIKNWRQTEGTIVKRDKSIKIDISIGKLLQGGPLINKSEDMPDRKPSFQYLVDDKEYEKRSRVEQTPGFRPGRIVNILYNPEDPQQATIDSFVQRGTILTVIGSGLLILSLILCLGSIVLKILV